MTNDSSSRTQPQLNAQTVLTFPSTSTRRFDRGTPVVDDYAPVHNSFGGRIHQVRFDLAEADLNGIDEARQLAVEVHQ